MCSSLADHLPSLSLARSLACTGLATVTPCAGYIRPWAAFVVGIAGAVFCYLSCELKNRMQWDDALDVWGVHGMGGALGSILIGVLAALLWEGLHASCAMMAAHCVQEYGQYEP